MNRFLKMNFLWLGLLGLALIIVLLAYVLRPKSPEYKTNENISLQLIGDIANRVELKDVEGKQLIDIRTSDLFMQGHAENALNIPLRQLLDKESIVLINQLSANGKDIVLYGSDELQATAPWLLFQQLGYNNIKLLVGGITSGGAMNETAKASSEGPIFDPAMLNVKTVQTKAPEAKVVSKRETVVPVRKETSSGGGC